MRVPSGRPADQASEAGADGDGRDADGKRHDEPDHLSQQGVQVRSRGGAADWKPAIHHCTDRFYGQIDSDLAKWRYEEDLKLKVPYAVKENRRRRLEHARLRKYAIERGLV